MATYRREGKHQPLTELKQEQIQGNLNNGYILSYIPTYPRPELHVSHVSHSTDLEGLWGIKEDGGFKDPGIRPNDREPKVVWFSLTVSRDELRDAESREMTLVHPRGPEEGFRPPLVHPSAGPRVHPPAGPRVHPPAGPEDEPMEEGCDRGQAEGVLLKFASSPAFKSSSRYGSFRFTFSLKDVLEKYSQQFCGGQQPVLRVFRTDVYKQEVMYSVLVHGPTNQEKFSSQYPLLEETPYCICAFREDPEPHFVWRPQAMSNAHKFGLEADNRNLVTTELNKPYFYMWDHVTLALHVDDEMLKFEDHVLRENLTYCNQGEVKVPKDGFWIEYQTFGDAEDEVRKLWPLKKFTKSQFHIC